MENLDIRLMLSDYKIRHIEVARELGIKKSSFSRLMSKPLSERSRVRVMAAIDRILERRSAENEKELCSLH